MADTNYAQNPKENSWDGPYKPPQPTPLRIANIPDTLELYLAMKEVPHPKHPGQYIRMDDLETRNIMCGRSPGVSVKYIDVPEYGKLVHFQKTWDENEDPSFQWDPAELELAREIRGNVLAGFERANGKSAFPPDTTAIISNTTDPMYIQLQNQGFNQSAKTTYSSYSTTPGNTAFTTTENSSNGGPIIYFSYSRYPDASRDDIFEEAWQQYTNSADPLSGGGVGDWVMKPDYTLTDFGKETMLLIYTVNQGTPLN